MIVNIFNAWVIFGLHGDFGIRACLSYSIHFFVLEIFQWRVFTTQYWVEIPTQQLLVLELLLWKWQQRRHEWCHYIHSYLIKIQQTAYRIIFWCTMRCRYNAVNFHPNPKKHRQAMELTYLLTWCSQTIPVIQGHLQRHEHWYCFNFNKPAPSR